MEQQALHPNLARIAVSHANLRDRISKGLISAADAQIELKSLVARDDSGVMWTIDATGVWMRFTLTGDLVVDTPPTYGLATPTPWEVSQSAPNSVNPDTGMARIGVDDESLWASHVNAGQARMPETGRGFQMVEPDRDNVGVILLAVTFIAIVIGAALFIF